MSKKPIIRRPSPLRARSKTPGSKDNKNQRDKREGGVMKMFRNLNPFDRTPTPTTKKTQSVTVSLTLEDEAQPPTQIAFFSPVIVLRLQQSQPLQQKRQHRLRSL